MESRRNIAKIILLVQILCAVFIATNAERQHSKDVADPEEVAMFNPTNIEEEDFEVDIMDMDDDDDDDDATEYGLAADDDSHHRAHSVLPKEQQKQQEAISALAQQLMMVQFSNEERIRSEGGSGIKQVRSNRGGTQPFHYAYHTEKAVASNHNHANHIRTVGMGEVIAVLNGVEFRTRHNDYQLKQPHRSSTAYHATEDIDFPDVPPAVLNKRTKEEQIDEMRLWFKAFKEQDSSVRDYKQYFKPVLCYLEGAWTLGGKDIEESFDSDRHFLDASSWLDMLEKVRFTSATGRKSQKENFAFLPTTLIGMKNKTTPIFAQWNYRILCHKLSREVPTGKFRAVDDLATRFGNKYTYDKYLASRAVRFRLHNYPEHVDAAEAVSMLDHLMSEIPGKDNYKGVIVDNAFDSVVYDFNGSQEKPKNAAYYHRAYMVKNKDAMGINTRHRGYSDPSLFVALNSQQKVAPVQYSKCFGRRRNRACYKVTQRVSYAIPLEIIYMTPLLRWNPCNITYKGFHKTPEARSVYMGGRNGQKNISKAFNGIHSKLYYMTPAGFYAGKRGDRDKADTVRNSVGVLSSTGTMHSVTASGTFIVLPDIEGVGTVRLRYPIMPVHAEGNAIWKELQALKESVMHMERNLHMFSEIPPMGGATQRPPVTRETTYTFYTGVSHLPGSVDTHFHTFTMSSGDFNAMTRFGFRSYTTSYDNGHEHRIKVRYNRNSKKFWMFNCDGRARCWDKHDRELTYKQD